MPQDSSKYIVDYYNNHPQATNASMPDDEILSRHSTLPETQRRNIERTAQEDAKMRDMMHRFSYADLPGTRSDAKEVAEKAKHEEVTKAAEDTRKKIADTEAYTQGEYDRGAAKSYDEGDIHQSGHFKGDPKYVRGPGSRAFDMDKKLASKIGLTEFTAQPSHEAVAQMVNKLGLDPYKKYELLHELRNDVEAGLSKDMRDPELTRQLADMAYKQWANPKPALEYNQQLLDFMDKYRAAKYKGIDVSSIFEQVREYPGDEVITPGGPVR